MNGARRERWNEMSLTLCHPCATALTNADTSGLSADDERKLNAFSEEHGYLVIDGPAEFPNGDVDCDCCGSSAEASYSAEPV